MPVAENCLTQPDDGRAERRAFAGMTFFITDEFRAAFGYDMSADTMKVIDGALDHGMREEAVIMAIYHTRNDVEDGKLEKNQTPDERVVQRLRHMYKGGIR